MGRTRRSGRWPELVKGRRPADLDLTGVSVPDPVPAAVPSELLKQRLDILTADALVKANAAGVSVATAQMFPSLSLSAAYGQRRFTWLAATVGTGALWDAGLSLSR